MSRDRLAVDACAWMDIWAVMAGLPQDVSAKEHIGLSDSGQGHFYADDSCHQEIHTVVLNSWLTIDDESGAFKTIYFKAGDVGKFSFIFVDLGATGLMPLSLQYAAYKIAKLNISGGEDTQKPNECEGYQFQTVAGDGTTPVPVSSDTTIELGLQSASAAYFSDAKCTQQIKSVVMPADSSTVTVYHKDPGMCDTVVDGSSAHNVVGEFDFGGVPMTPLTNDNIVGEFKLKASADAAASPQCQPIDIPL